jgi:hypothetical protein
MTTLDQALQQFGALRQRARSGIWMEAAAMVLLAISGYALVTWPIDRHLRLEWPFRVVLLAGLAFGVARILRRRLLRPMSVALDDDEMALAVERRAPDLRQALISSLQFERALDGRGRGRIVDSTDLMSAVIADVRGRLGAVPFAAAIDAARVRRFTALAATLLALFVGWGVVDGSGLRIWFLRNLCLSSVEWPRYTQLSFVGATGNTVRLNQGDPLAVHVAAAGVVPDQVFLRYEYDGGERGVEPMSRTGDGEFSTTMDSVLREAVLVAEGGDGITEPLRVTIVERPRVDGVAIRVVFPEYMHKDPEEVPPTEGEIRLLRGSRLELRARTHKPAVSAFALYDDEKIPLQLDATRHEFGGSYTPKTSGLLKLDVIDEDQLGSGAPPRVQVRMVEDRPPTIDFKARGISSLITARARIPGELKVKDDFGITDVGGVFRVIDDAPEAKKPAGEKPAPAPEVPFEAIDPAFAEAPRKGAVKYETTATIDLLPLNKDQDKDAPDNRIRPGMLLSVRFQARDNFGPGEPHLANGELLSFRVVTVDKLLEELRRRQVEQRQELEHVRDDVHLSLLDLRDTANPGAAGEAAKASRTRLKAMSRQQQALGRRAAFVAEAYQRILWEFENNRLLEPRNVRELEAATSVPLTGLAKEAFPDTARQVDEFANQGDEKVRTSSVSGYEQILARLEIIIKAMGDAETLAAIIEQLKGVIKIEDQSAREVEKRIQDAAKALFKEQQKPDKDQKK